MSDVPIRVINIDNDRLARLQVETILRQQCNAVVEDAGLEEAWQRSAWTTFDVVLIDLHETTRALPRNDEFEACDLIRHIRSTSYGILIVVVTGAYRAYQDPIVRGRLSNAGANCILPRRELETDLPPILRDPASWPTLAIGDRSAPELGVSDDSRIQSLVEAAKGRDLLRAHLRGGTAGRVRSELTRKGNIAAVSMNDNERGAPLRDRNASIEQLRRIIKRATREVP